MPVPGHFGSRRCTQCAAFGVQLLLAAERVIRRVQADLAPGVLQLAEQRSEFIGMNVVEAVRGAGRILP
jgi:hypothetical protein